MTEIEVDSTRICGIELKHFVNETEYLFDIYNYYSQHGTVFLLGDLNCKIQGPRYNFPHDCRGALVDCLLRNTDSMSLHVQDFSEGPIWTFQSYADGPKTVIDHIVAQRNNICDIVKVNVPEENLLRKRPFNLKKGGVMVFS